MNEVSERVRGWFAEGKRVVLATLVDTDGPSPRDAGAMFAVSSDHDLAGAISGGCVVIDARRRCRFDFRRRTAAPQFVRAGR